MELNVTALSLIDVRPQLRVDHTLAHRLTCVAGVLLRGVVVAKGHLKLILEGAAVINRALLWRRRIDLHTAGHQRRIAFLLGQSRL